MLVRRILVPDDAMLAPEAGAPLVRAVPAARGDLFAEVMLEKSSTRPPRRLPKVVVSLGVHGVLLAALLFIPLYFTEAIDFHRFNETMLIAPPAAPPPPPPPGVAPLTRPAAEFKKVLAVPGKLTAPRVVPNRVAETNEAPGGPDLVAALTSGAGVPGGVPGGQPGGVLGGIVGGSGSYVPAAPAVSAPQPPIRVGGAVRAPRILSRVEPVYPLLARQAKLEGSVMIDAVIDEQGNVVEMHVLSGSPLLIPAAMDALRQWKYAPTLVNAQAVPVELAVTLTFRLG